MKKKSIFTLADINWLIDSMKLVFPTRDETITKIDKIDTRLDTFIGEIKTKREEQTLHDGDHQRIDKRITRLEKNAHLVPLVD